MDFIPAKHNASASSLQEPGGPAPKSFEDKVVDFEKVTGTKLLFICHPEGTKSLFSTESSITMTDAYNFVKSLRKLEPTANLSIILNTPGGSASAGEVIINALRNHEGIINMYVPFRSCSAGTAIALAGDKLFLGRNAHLSPFDPCFGSLGISAKTLLNSLPEDPEKDGFMSLLYKPLRTASQRAMHRTERLVDEISSENFSEEQLARIKKKFINGDIDHDTPIFYSELELFLGNFVSPNIPDNVYDIYDAYMEKNTKAGGGLLSGFGM